MSSRSFYPKKYKTTFLTIISIILATVLISMSIIISDPAVAYDKRWFYGSIFFSIVILGFLGYLFKIQPNPRYTLILFSIISIFLISFGMTSLPKNEIINPKQYINSESILYYYKDLLNDNIAIFAILAGSIVLLLMISDYLFC